MITDDMVRRARRATSEADDCLLVALVTVFGDRVSTIDSAIASLRDAAEALGYTLVEKDDGK